MGGGEKKGKSVLGRKLGQGEVNETKKGSEMLCVGLTLIDGGGMKKGEEDSSSPLN